MKIRSPEVDPGHYPTLNESFYRAEPSTYLDSRLWALLAMIGQPAGGEAAPTQLSYEGLDFTWSDDGQAERDRYAALESTVLLHHACETLLRLYLAHAFEQECPWLAISKLRAPSAFPDAVKAMLADLDRPDRVSDVLRVFTVVRTAPEFNKDLPVEIWDAHARALVDVLRFAARTILDDAKLYNGVKHGLAVLAGPHALRIGNEDGTLIDHSGLALEVLDNPIDKKLGERRWVTSTVWVDPVKAIRVVSIVVTLLGSLWESGRIRYDQGGDPTKIRLLDEVAVQEVLSLRPSPSGLLSMSWNIPHLPLDSPTA